MNAWIKIGCFLTGWNKEILQSCSEASYKHLRKYTSALLILIVLWAFTGYCFAERYIHAPWWGCLLSSFLFIVVVVQIERQIILTVGSIRMIAWFRVFIAIIMAIIGSSIIDQIIFADDIDKKMIEVRDRQVKEQLPLRLEVINAKLLELQTMTDALDKVNMESNKELSKNPVITSVGSSTTYIKELQADGSYLSVPQTTITKVPVENPLVKQIETNNENLKRFREQQKEFTEKKLRAEEDLRRELGAKTGFLEELSAMLEIMRLRIEALLFYSVIFLFLISLELFVVFSKIGDKKCDYDLIIEHQLNTKKRQLEELLKS